MPVAVIFPELFIVSIKPVLWIVFTVASIVPEFISVPIFLFSKPWSAYHEAGVPVSLALTIAFPLSTVPSPSLSVVMVPVLLKFSIIPSFLTVCQLDLIEPELLSSVILPHTFTQIAALSSVGSGISLVCFMVPVLVKTLIWPY